MGLMYSTTFRGAMILSVFVVYPENNRKGTKITGAISMAIVREGTKVPMKIPIKVATRAKRMVTRMKVKKCSTPLLKLTK